MASKYIKILEREKHQTLGEKYSTCWR